MNPDTLMTSFLRSMMRTYPRSSVADAHSGEAVRLVVVKKDPGLTVEALQAHCREHLTGYKCPRSVVFATELPKSNVGKILRRELRERYAAGAAVGC